MNAKVDEALMQNIDAAFERIMKPARVVSRGEARFQRFTPEQQVRLIGHWLAQQKDQDGWITDCLICIRPNDILANFEKGDHAANGELIRRALLSLGKTIGEDDQYWSK